MAKKIYINPGHSDVDPGAVGYATERELNVKVSTYMNAYLLANYNVETRMNPGSINSTREVAKDANAWGADLFVSNHFNAAGGDGYEALVCNEKRRSLGEIFEKHVKAIGQNSRGVKIRPGLVVLNSTNMPAVLNEGAFVDNKKDIQDWDEDHELKKMGEAYAKAAAEYMGLSKKTQVNTPSVKPSAETVSVTLKVINKGDTGDQVKTVQRLLTVRPECKITSVDGIYGNETYAAVCAFKKKVGLSVNGTVDLKTWNKLLGIV